MGFFIASIIRATYGTIKHIKYTRRHSESFKIILVYSKIEVSCNLRSSRLLDLYLAFVVRSSGLLFLTRARVTVKVTCFPVVARLKHVETPHANSISQTKCLSLRVSTFLTGFFQFDRPLAFGAPHIGDPKWYGWSEIRVLQFHGIHCKRDNIFTFS